MLRIVVEILGGDNDPQGVKEKLATDFERFGDVRVVEVKRVEAEQIKIEACAACAIHPDPVSMVDA